MLVARQPSLGFGQPQPGPLELGQGRIHLRRCLHVGRIGLGAKAVLIDGLAFSGLFALLYHSALKHLAYEHRVGPFAWLWVLRVGRRLRLGPLHQQHVRRPHAREVLQRRRTQRVSDGPVLRRRFEASELDRVPDFPAYLTGTQP